MLQAMSFKQKVTSCAVYYSLQRRPYTIISILIHSWKQMCLYSFISEFFLLWALQQMHSWAVCCRMSGSMTASSIIQQINFIEMTRGIWAFVSAVRPIVLQNFHPPPPVFSSRDVSGWLGCWNPSRTKTRRSLITLRKMSGADLLSTD